jgi:hypothetical protein
MKLKKRKTQLKKGPKKIQANVANLQKPVILIMR